MSYVTQPESAPVEDIEFERFTGICRAAWITGHASIRCEGPGAARRIRQRFYRLREKFEGEARSQANALIFKLNGCIIEVEKKPNYEVSLERREEANETQDEPLTSNSNRLNN